MENQDGSTQNEIIFQILTENPKLWNTQIRIF